MKFYLIPNPPILIYITHVGILGLLFAFAIAASITLFPCLIGISVLSGMDYLTVRYPLYDFASAYFKTNGDIPSWLPQIFCGIPFRDSLVPSSLYPTELLAIILNIPAHIFFSWDSWLHLILAGLGASMLARSHNLSKWPVVFAGATFMLGGYMTSQIAAGTTVFVRGTALLPWAFLFFNKCLEKRNFSTYVALFFIFALLSLTSAYQILCYACLMLPLYGLFISKANKTASIINGVIFIIGGILFSLISILPAMQYLHQSIRALPGTLWTNQDSFPASSLLSLFQPVSGPAPDTKYLGLTTAILFMIALLRSRNRIFPWLIILAFSFVFSLGNFTPAGRLLGILPIYGSFRASTHWLSFFQLSFVMVAAFGLDNLLSYPFKLKHTTAVISVILCLITCADLLRQGTPLQYSSSLQTYRAMESNEDPLIRFMENRAKPFRIHSMEYHNIINSRIPTNLEWSTGYHGAPLSQYQDYLDALNGNTRVSRINLLDCMNIKYIVRRSPSFNSFHALIAQINSPLSGNLSVYENPSCLPRAYFADKVIEAGPSNLNALDHLCSEESGSRSAYINLPCGDTLRASASKGEISKLEIYNNRIKAVVSATGFGLVVFSESWYPAWSAYVDGKREWIYRTNVMFRGIPITKGRHEILMIYNSILFKIGLLVSMLLWTASLTFLFMSNWRNARPF